MTYRIITRTAHAILAAGALAVPLTAQLPTEDTTSSEPNAQVIERILVKVNGEIITQTDLEDRQVAAIRARGAQPSTNAELFQLLNEVTPEVIGAAVDELLLVQRGKELGYQLSDDQFRDFLDNLKEENGFETDEEFTQTLSQQEGITLDDFRRLVERQMLASQVQQIEILNRVAITDVEAREYYESHIADFTEPATATLREIIIAVPETDGTNLMVDRQARSRATEVLQRLGNGEDFAEVAQMVSDSPSKDNGGLIGPFQLSEISDTIRELIATLEIGDASEVRRTPQGYQILKLEALTEDVAQPFEDVRDEISNNVFNDRRLEEYSDYLENLREEAIIEWKSEDLRKEFEAFLATQPAGSPPI